VVAALIEANFRLAKQLEDRSKKLKEIKALLENERADRKGQRTFNPSPDNCCGTSGYKVANINTIQSCNYPKDGYKRESTMADNMGGTQANRECCVG
jgi:hypothetical protein